MSTAPDFHKRASHKARLLELLADGAWHGMREVQAVAGWRYSARVCELRKEGYRIETRPIFGDAWEMRWCREATQPDLFQSEVE